MAAADDDDVVHGEGFSGTTRRAREGTKNHVLKSNFLKIAMTK
jgi:hypothetical protein